MQRSRGLRLFWSVAAGLIAVSTAIGIWQQTADGPRVVRKDGLQIYVCRPRGSGQAVRRVEVDFNSGRRKAILSFKGRVMPMEFRYHFLFEDHYGGSGVGMRLDPEVYFDFDDGLNLGPCNPEPVYEGPV